MTRRIVSFDSPPRISGGASRHRRQTRPTTIERARALAVAAARTTPAAEPADRTHAADADRPVRRPAAAAPGTEHPEPEPRQSAAGLCTQHHAEVARAVVGRTPRIEYLRSAHRDHPANHRDDAGVRRALRQRVRHGIRVWLLSAIPVQRCAPQLLLLGVAQLARLFRRRGGRGVATRAARLGEHLELLELPFVLVHT